MKKFDYVVYHNMRMFMWHKYPKFTPPNVNILEIKCSNGKTYLAEPCYCHFDIINGEVVFKEPSFDGWGIQWNLNWGKNMPKIKAWRYTEQTKSMEKR